MKTITEILSNTQPAWRLFVLKKPCLEWQRGISTGGYGRVRYEGKQRQAHRVLYEALVAPVPSELDLDHLCRNRCCCEPSHLRPATRRENLLSGGTIPSANAAKTHCPKGHEYSPENTYLYKNGSRMCKICMKARWREWYDRTGADQAKAHPEKGRERTRRWRERKHRQPNG